MPVFNLSEEVSAEHEPEPRFRKEEPASCVLFATNGAGCVVVIDRIGSDAAYAMAESREDLLEELRVWTVPGFALWFGRVVGRRDYWGEYDEEIVGECRALNAEEIERLTRDDFVWDPREWYEDYDGKTK